MLRCFDPSRVKRECLLFLILSWLPLTAIAQDPANTEAGTADESTIPVQERPPREPAAAAPPDEVVEFEAVIITGQKLGRTLDETASSVRVLGNDDLNAQGDEDAFDALRRVANATANRNGQFTLRGINSTGVDSSEFGRQTASIYVDGVALDRVGLQSGATEAFDVERVEVLRGNQGTSQGRNALAGSIVIESIDPTDYDELVGRVAGAEVGRIDFGLAGGGPITGTTAYRLVAHTRRDPGEVTNVTLNDPTWQRDYVETFRAKAAWRPFDFRGLDAVFTVQNSSRERGEASFGNFESYADAPNNRRTSKANTPDLHLQDSTLFSLQGELDGPLGGRWVSTSSVQLADERFVRDGDYSNFENIVFRATSDGLTATQELRLQFQGYGKLSGVFGLFGAHTDITYVGEQTDFVVNLSSLQPAPPEEVPVTPPPIPGQVLADFDFGFDSRQSNAALFAELDYAFTPRLTGTLGLRYDYEESTTATLLQVRRADLQACAEDILPLLAAAGISQCSPGISVLAPLNQSGIIPQSDGQDADSKYDAFLPKIGLRYEWTDNVTVFGTYSIGYRAGGADALVTTGEIREFDPETTNNYELGFRSNWFGRRLGIDLNLFYTQWNDQQVQQLTENGADSFTANAAESELYGAELETRYQLASTLRGYASVGLVHTEFLDYINGRNNFTGNQFGRAPEKTASTGLEWRPTLLGSPNWLLTTSLNYTEGAFAFPENDPRQRSDSHAVWDMKAGYDAPRLGITLFARNLLNRDYATFRIYDPPMDSNPEEGQRVLYGPLRQIGLRFDIRF